MAVLMIISAVIIVAHIGCQRSFITGIELVSLQSQSRQALHWLRRDLKWASSVLNSRQIDSVTYTTANNELVLAVPSIDSSGDIIPGSVDYVVYHLNSTDTSVLERIVGAGALSARPSGVHVVARDVSAIIFSSGGTGLTLVPVLSSISNVSIDLSIGSQVLGGRDLQSNAITSITMRNLEQ